VYKRQVEIENWDDSRQEANLWIKAPSISPQQQTEFYLYYDSTADDNTDWVGDTGDVAAQNVWDDKFVGVWHLAQDPTTVSGILDSTVNVAHGDPQNMESADLEDGKAGEALHFDGSNEYVSIADNSILNAPSSMTWEVLAKSDVSNTTEQRLFAYNDDGVYITTSINAGFSDQIRIYCYADAGGTWSDTTTAYDVTEYRHIVGKATENNTFSLLVDGNVIGTPASLGNFQDLGSQFGRNIGAGRNATTLADGLIDEVRISSTERSSAWLKATYYTLFDDMIYFRMPWDDTHSEILLTVSGSLINEDLTNFPLTLTLASGVGTNTVDVTKIFDGLTLSGTLGYSDDFTGWNGDVPDPLLWNTIGDPTIQSNKLRIHDTGNVETKYVISGDCEFTVDWEDVVAPSTDSYWWELRITYDSDNYHGMAKGYWSGATRYDSAGKKGGGAFSGATTTSHTGGKFRFVRGGTTWDCYYWTGAAWSQSGLGNAQQTSMPSGDLTVKLLTSRWGGSPSIDVDFDNFTVVSGTVHADQTRKKIAIFSDGDQHTGDKCFTEIEHWDSVNETAALHVQVPTLTSGTDTDLYLYEDINQPDQDYRLISEANDTFTGTTGDSPDPTKWTCLLYTSPSPRD